MSIPNVNFFFRCMKIADTEPDFISLEVSSLLTGYGLKCERNQSLTCMVHCPV